MGNDFADPLEVWIALVTYRSNFHDDFSEAGIRTIYFKRNEETYKIASTKLDYVDFKLEYQVNNGAFLEDLYLIDQNWLREYGLHV